MSEVLAECTMQQSLASQVGPLAAQLAQIEHVLPILVGRASYGPEAAGAEEAGQLLKWARDLLVQQLTALHASPEVGGSDTAVQAIAAQAWVTASDTVKDDLVARGAPADTFRVFVVPHDASVTVGMPDGTVLVSGPAEGVL